MKPLIQCLCLQSELCGPLFLLFWGCFTAMAAAEVWVLLSVEKAYANQSYSCSIYSCETGLRSRCLHQENTVLHSHWRLQGSSSSGTRTHTHSWGLFIQPVGASNVFTFLTIQLLCSGKCFICNSAPSQRGNSLCPLQSLWKTWTRTAANNWQMNSKYLLPAYINAATTQLYNTGHLWMIIYKKTIL